MRSWLREFVRSWKGMPKLEIPSKNEVRITPPDPRVVWFRNALSTSLKSPWMVTVVGGLVLAILVHFAI
jgi:hypothetical protein